MKKGMRVRVKQDVHGYSSCHTVAVMGEEGVVERVGSEEDSDLPVVVRLNRGVGVAFSRSELEVIP